MPRNTAMNFAQILMSLNKGLVQAECTEALRRLVTAVETTAKPGSMTLKITLVPGKDAQPGAELDQLGLQAKLDVKAPGPSFAAGFFFVDEDHGLSRDHSRQTDIEEFTGITAVENELSRI